MGTDLHDLLLHAPGGQTMEDPPQRLDSRDQLKGQILASSYPIKMRCDVLALDRGGGSSSEWSFIYLRFYFGCSMTAGATGRLRLLAFELGGDRLRGLLKR